MENCVGGLKCIDDLKKIFTFKKRRAKVSDDGSYDGILAPDDNFTCQTIS